MRIVAGSVRGRTLRAPRGADVIRPTSDRVRESIFNVLGQWCEALTVLDLYCGTGALALEALSRGAARAVLVDSGREAQRLAAENAEALGFTAQVELLPLKVEKAIERLSARGDRFELIFADPPYALTAIDGLLASLSTHPLLSSSGVLVIEHSKHEPAPQQAGLFTQRDQRRFGETVVTLFALT